MSFRQRIKDRYNKLCTTDNIIDLSVDAFILLRRHIDFTYINYS